MGGNRGRGKIGRGAKLAGHVQYQKADNSQATKESSSSIGATITTELLEQLLKLLPTPSKQGGADTDEDMDCNYAGMVTCYSARVAKSKWILDSGATHHMTGDSSKLINIFEVDKPIRIGPPNGDTAAVTQKGEAYLNKNLKLHNVMYVPAFQYNLICIQKLVRDSNCEVKFTGSFCIIKENESEPVKGIGRAKRGLYIYLDDTVSTTVGGVIDVVKKGEMDDRKMTVNAATELSKMDIPGSIKLDNPLRKEMLWHQRLGHAPMERIKKIEELKGKVKECGEHCLICPQEKFSKLPYGHNKSRASEIFELIHIDIWGPYKTPTRRGHKYFLTMVDDHSRTTWIHLMKQKSQAFEAIKELVNQGETQFGKKVKIIRSDNALEFNDKECKYLYQAKGIIHQTSCGDRPQQNGIVERKHRNILEMSRALRMQAGLPIHMWGDTVMAAVYITNRLPTAVLSNKIPYEVLFNKYPDYKCMKTFGCLAMCYNPNRSHDKFQARGVPCIFIGYPQAKKDINC
ncbi:Retrovirus-related Pol polyprotein from transposon TNT 1-94 [Bienertia sinuspersici]